MKRKLIIIFLSFLLNFNTMQKFFVKSYDCNNNNFLEPKNYNNNINLYKKNEGGSGGGPLHNENIDKNYSVKKIKEKEIKAKNNSMKIILLLLSNIFLINRLNKSKKNLTKLNKLTLMGVYNSLFFYFYK